MFERFTERACQVVVLAQDEARALKHDYIGTEHILLGLLREENGLAARALESLDVTLEEVRARVVTIVGRGDEATTGQIPFTPRGKKVLELSLREALSLGHKYIGTEYILIAIAQENEGVAARILLDFDADAHTIWKRVMSMLGDPARSRDADIDMPLLLSEDEELDQIRTEKEAAIEENDFERASMLRERERQLVFDRRAREQAALGGPGTAPHMPRVQRRRDVYDVPLAVGGCAFAFFVALSAIVDRQRADAYVLGLAAAFLALFLAALWVRLRQRNELSAAVIAAAGGATVALYAVLALQHLRVPSPERDTEGWMFAISFPQAALLVAAALAIGGVVGVVTAAGALLQLASAVLLMYDRTDGTGVALSAGSFAIWAAAYGLFAIGTRERVRL